MEWYCLSDSDTPQCFEATSALDAKWYALLLTRGYKIQRINHPEMCELGSCFYVDDWRAFVCVCEDADLARLQAFELAEQLPEHTIVLIDQEPGPSKSPVTICCTGAKDASGDRIALEGKFLIGGATDLDKNNAAPCFVFWAKDGNAFEPTTRTQFNICLCKYEDCKNCQRWAWFADIDEWTERTGNCPALKIQSHLTGKECRPARLERLTTESEVWELKQYSQYENLFLKCRPAQRNSYAS